MGPAARLILASWLVAGIVPGVERQPAAEEARDRRERIADAAASMACGSGKGGSQRDPETAGVSAPVFGPGRTLLGALTLAGPRSRVDQAFLRGMKRPLLEAAVRATRAFGEDASALEQASRQAKRTRKNGLIDGVEPSTPTLPSAAGTQCVGFRWPADEGSRVNRRSLDNDQRATSPLNDQASQVSDSLACQSNGRRR
ncbi:hypothetical protein [Mesorhizobium sp. M0578]|uniref:hypothetical protein n=1 Tax=unclassified Mesorhizobium TaxID=325217 RepID=UPI0033371097